MRGTSPEETIMDLVREDRSRIGTLYFMMSDENLKRQLRLPWVSFASDANSIAAEGVFLKSSAHPRAYGSFARVLGKYVRDEEACGCGSPKSDRRPSRLIWAPDRDRMAHAGCVSPLAQVAGTDRRRKPRGRA